jgi:hypothetical protein
MTLECGRAHVVQVSGDLTARAGDAVPQVKPHSGRGRRPMPRHRCKPVGLRVHGLAADRCSPPATATVTARC